MIIRSNGSLALTPAGQTEAQRLVNALRAWLVEQLADWKQSANARQINQALDHIARQMLTDDETDSRPPQPALTNAPAG